MKVDKSKVAPIKPVSPTDPNPPKKQPPKEQPKPMKDEENVEISEESKKIRKQWTHDQIVKMSEMTDAYHHLLEATKHLEKGSARFLEVMGVAIEIKCDILSMKVGAK